MFACYLKIEIFMTQAIPRHFQLFLLKKKIFLINKDSFNYQHISKTSLSGAFFSFLILIGTPNYALQFQHYNIYRLLLSFLFTTFNEISLSAVYQPTRISETV
jgi:hypothetical protein